MGETSHDNLHQAATADPSTSATSQSNSRAGNHSSGCPVPKRRDFLAATGISALAATVATACGKPQSDKASKVNQQPAGGTLGAQADSGTASHVAPARAASAQQTAYSFYGDHQPGILTPAQDRMHFAALDLSTASRDDVISLFKDWTIAAQQLMQGRPLRPHDGGGEKYEAPPVDTGETLGLPASGLTITFGLGRSFFQDEKGKPRFGLDGKLPDTFKPLPHFPADKLDAARSDGDLCIQACADDPLVAVHAIRNLVRIAIGKAVLKWSQLGFGRTSSTTTAQQTPRNLFGFKDGTNNIKAEESKALTSHVWVGSDDGAGWLAGGTYLVARRIAMDLEIWDRTSLAEQETLIGRSRPEGAPLSGGKEFTPLDFARLGQADKPLIGETSHVALVHPSNNDGQRMLRRGYNYTDGHDNFGRFDAGLFFIAFVRDVQKQFVPIQMKMSRQDGLMEYLQHRSSGLYAIPPGVAQGEYLAQKLFET